MEFQFSQDQLRVEENRRRTYYHYGWSARFSNADDLAKDGFYYTGIDNQIKCIFCDMLYYSSFLEDIYWFEHRLRIPRCPHVFGSPCGNIPLNTVNENQQPESEIADINLPIQNETGDEEAQSNDNNTSSEASDAEVVDENLNLAEDEIPLINRESTTPIRTPLIPLINRLPTIAEVRSNRRFTNLPIHSSYSRRRARRVISTAVPMSRRRYFKPLITPMRDFNARLASFESWPIPEIIEPQALAEAGFFYTKMFDATKCFHCSGTIRQWSESDDPWAVHSFYFPKCPFLYLMRGQIFADSILSPTDKTTSLPETPEPSKDTNRYTCKICMDKEIGTVLAPCDHAVMCIECSYSLNLGKCPICNTEISHICRMKMID